MGVPPKTPRPTGPDEWAAERIRYERERRGWSTAELARRVTLMGVTLRQQQVWQVESGKPPRRLSVGEAAAFARAFGLSLAELMTPPPSAEASHPSLVELARAFAEWRRDAGILAARLQDIGRQIGDLGPDALYQAETVVKYGGLNEAVEQTAADLGALSRTYAELQQSVMERGTVWAVMASVRDLVSDDEAGDIAERQQPVVAAVVTSALGVLVGRRNDGKPPWTFIAGEVEPGEQPEDAAVREVKEETGCEVEAAELIGERVHPKTDRRMIYMAATPTHGTDVFVGDSDELAEVRWVGLAEADELLPGMYEPVREYLARTLGQADGPH